MFVKIFLGMEWVLILNGDVGLYIYLFFLAWFAPKYCNANGYSNYLHFFSSVLRRAPRIVSFRAAMGSSAR